MTKDYMNITQAAKFLSCHKDTIRSYLKKGLFKNYLYRSKREGYLIHKNDLVKVKEPLDIPEGFNSLKEAAKKLNMRSEEHTSELQSRGHLVCRLLLEKKKHQANW